MPNAYSVVGHAPFWYEVVQNVALVAALGWGVWDTRRRFYRRE